MCNWNDPDPITYKISPHDCTREDQCWMRDTIGEVTAYRHWAKPGYYGHEWASEISSGAYDER